MEGICSHFFTPPCMSASVWGVGAYLVVRGRPHPALRTPGSTASKHPQGLHHCICSPTLQGGCHCGYI